MYMRDVIDRALLPQEVSFHQGDDLSFDLQTAKGGVAEKLSPLTLRNMYEVSYLQGNAIHQSKGATKRSLNLHHLQYCTRRLILLTN